MDRYTIYIVKLENNTLLIKKSNSIFLEILSIKF